MASGIFILLHVIYEKSGADSFIVSRHLLTDWMSVTIYLIKFEFCCPLILLAGPFFWSSILESAVEIHSKGGKKGWANLQSEQISRGGGWKRK